MSVKVAVVGSFNIDVVVRTARRPNAGETITGASAGLFVGGKGCNQGIAAARLGAAVAAVGRVGRDAFGEQLLLALRREGVRATHVYRDGKAGTGIASILVGDDGENSIVVVPGANGDVSPSDVEAAADAITSAHSLLLQLEIPLEANQRAAALARSAGVRVILNPAPARPLPPALLGLVDVVVPNEHEARVLTGVEATVDPAGAARALRRQGIGAAIVTLGSRGAYLSSADDEALVPTFMVQPVDTTAAGDAFCAGVAVALAEGTSLHDAVRFGNGAGALACTRMGAEPSLPLRADVDRLVR